MNGAEHFLQSLAHRGPDTMTCRQTHGRGGHGSAVDSGKFLLLLRTQIRIQNFLRNRTQGRFGF